MSHVRWQRGGRCTRSRARSGCLGGTSDLHPLAREARRTRPSGGQPIGAPGFEPGTSATRTQRSTGLSHAPDPTRVQTQQRRGGIDLPAVGRLASHRLRASRYLLRRSSQTHSVIFCEYLVGSNTTAFPINGRGGIDLASLGRLAKQPSGLIPRPLRRSTQTHSVIFCEDLVGSNTTAFPINGRGGIRTHAGVSPHDFQSCALSHSATRPRPFVPRKGTDHPFSGGSGMDLAFARSSRATPSRLIPRPLRRSTQTHFVIFCEDHVGSNTITALLHPFSGGSGIRTHAVLPPTP